LTPLKHHATVAVVPKGPWREEKDAMKIERGSERVKIKS